MCRFLLYLGPEELLSTVVIDPDHGMIQQSSKAHCPITPLNADGFGVAWYARGVSIPGCFKDASPAWSNQNLKSIARVTKSHCIFAHVRAASKGNVNEVNCHPFIFKNLTLMHNGTVPHYNSIKRRMLGTLSDRAFHLIQGTTDSELVFAMFVTHFEKRLGMSDCEDSDDSLVPYPAGVDYTETMTESLRDTLHQIHEFAIDHERTKGIAPDTQVVHTVEDGADTIDTPYAYTSAIGRLNIAVTDGSSAVAARYVCSDPATAHSLYYTRGTKLEYTKEKKCCVAKCHSNPTMAIVSSEPLGAEFECERVPPNHMIVIGPNHFSVESCH